MTVREDPWNPYTRMTQSNCIKRASAWNQLWWLVQPRIHQDRIECKPRMEIRLDETEDICYIFRVQNIVFRVRKQSIIRRQLKMQWENSNQATNKVQCHQHTLRFKILPSDHTIRTSHRKTQEIHRLSIYNWFNLIEKSVIFFQKTKRTKIQLMTLYYSNC